MRVKDLFESPMADFDFFGDANKEGSFRSTDLRAIANPKWREKVFKAFKDTPFNFNVYVYNGDEGMAPVGHKGSRFGDSELVKVNDLANLSKYVGLQSLKVVEKIIGKVPPNADNSITILLVENEGADRLALTPWILAHRIGHAIFYAGQADPTRGPVAGQNTTISTAIQDVNRTINGVFNSMERQLQHFFDREEFQPKTDVQRINAVAKHIATFRSGKMGNLSNSGEFAVELFTQYLVKGRVIFNRPTIDDEGRSKPTDSPSIDPELRSIAKQHKYREDFIKAALKQKYRFKEAPRNPNKSAKSFVAYDSDGQAIASFGEDRIKKYEDMGYRVSESPPPTKQSIARYNTYLKRSKELNDLYNEIIEKGSLFEPRKTRTDISDITLSNAEMRINEIFEILLKACVGKALVL